MFLKKVCIFLAVILLAVDIFLLSMYFEAKKNLNVISDKMIENTVKYYESIGVTVEESCIMPKIPDNNIYTFDEKNVALGLDASNVLAQRQFSKDAVVTAIETPDGMTYSIVGKDGKSAGFRVYENSFAFEYVHSDYLLNDDRAAVVAFSNANTSIDKGVERAIDDFLISLCGTEGLSYKVVGSYSSTDRQTVCLQYRVEENCMVEDMFAVVVCSDKKILFAQGNIILDSIKKSYSEELCDGVNALSKIDAELVSSFVSEEIVYSHRTAGSGVHYLIPVWKIEYIDVEGRTCTQYVDAIKG